MTVGLPPNLKNHPETRFICESNDLPRERSVLSGGGQFPDSFPTRKRWMPCSAPAETDGRAYFPTRRSLQNLQPKVVFETLFYRRLFR
ncbi:hypothetical protein [Antarctobacter jejuensis]|uniref:hypothetical protein n=1 Tax=Antarctobacter jejuensis TaxID=1439938 RepID=UPI003FD2508D